MKCFKSKSDTAKAIESIRGNSIEEILRELYVDQNMTTHEVAGALKVNYTTAFRWLKAAGIYSHKLSSLKT